MRPSLTWVTVAVVVVSLTAVTVSAASPVDAKPLAANGPNVAAESSKPAVVRNATWYLRDSTTSGAADHVFQYGDPGDIPVFGDWDRNGTRTPGVFRSGVWYLRNSNTTGVADVVLTFGDPGDTPITGDWNGDGIDSPGVARAGDDKVPNGGNTTCQGCAFRWLVRNENSSGLTDTEYDCGNVRPVPWPGDAADPCGYVIGNEWTVKNPDVGSTEFTYGNPGDAALRWT